MLYAVLQSYEILWSGEHSLLLSLAVLGMQSENGLCPLWQVTGSPQPPGSFFLFFFNKKEEVGLSRWRGHAESAGHALSAKY